MNIAFLMPTDQADIDRVLSGLAWRLENRGLRVCGTVQANIQRESDCRCDMDLQVLPEGPVIRISQDLGPEARGCRLDPAALETAVGIVEERLARGADILIVNRFGKHESEGHGFRSVIGEALVQDIPVLVGVNRLNREAFETFADGLAQELKPEIGLLETWAMTHLEERALRA